MDATNSLPPTKGRWVPIKSRARGVTGWIELFPTQGGGPWVTVPGASRHADADGNLLPLERE